MAYALVCAVVHVYEQRFPVRGQSVVVYRESVVLRCNEAAFCSGLTYGLVVAAVSVFEFVCACAGSLGEKLVAHAYAAYRFFAFERFAKVFYGVGGEVRVAGAVRHEYAVAFNLVEIKIPWNPHYSYAALYQTADLSLIQN